MAATVFSKSLCCFGCAIKIKQNLRHLSIDSVSSENMEVIVAMRWFKKFLILDWAFKMRFIIFKPQSKNYFIIKY